MKFINVRKTVDSAFDSMKSAGDGVWGLRQLIPNFLAFPQFVIDAVKHKLGENSEIRGTQP